MKIPRERFKTGGNPLGNEFSTARPKDRRDASTPETLGHSIYSAAYQYYKSRMGLSGRSRNPFWRFLDRSLHIQPARRRLGFRFPELRLWRRRMRLRNLVFHTLQDLLRHETQKTLFEDPCLRKIIRNGIPDSWSFENKWFDFVNRVSNKVLFHAGSALVEQISKGNLVRTLQSLGAAGGFYLFMAPYLVAFANFTAERRDIQTIYRFLGEAFARLQRAVPHLQLVLVGEGPFRPDLEERLQGSPCLFTGFLDGEDLASIFASCDLFVLPSTSDTFGNAVLEAQASGIPVIVTDMGGPQENVIPGETGLVVKGNDPFSLQEAIQRLVLDDSRRKAMGRAARKFAESHLKPPPVPFLC